MKTITKSCLIHVGARKLIPPNDILMLKADNNYTKVFLKDGSKILSSTTLGIIQKRLNGFDFFRVNRSTIVNINYLGKLQSATLELKGQGSRNTHQIKISRRRVNPFLDYLNQ